MADYTSTLVRKKVRPENNVFIRALKKQMFDAGELTSEEYVRCLPTAQREAVKNLGDAARSQGIYAMFMSISKFDLGRRVQVV